MSIDIPEPDIPEPDVSRELARAIPKVSLHCHLLGAVPAATAVELARTNGVALPGNPTAQNIYDSAAYEDLGEFLSVYDLIGAALVTREDYRRVTYESLTAFGSDHNVWYREIFVSPQPSPLPYPQALQGIIDGMRDAHTDTGIDSRIIMAINREHSLAEALEFVETVIRHRTDEVIGIGLDYAEINGPPIEFVPAFELARRAGLRRTAHSETGPPAAIEVILDQLHCSRVDHGYHVVTDDRILRRCVEQRIPFTATPVSSDIGRYSGSGDGSHRRIREMVDAGLLVCIDSDDPPMFGTDPTNDYFALGNALGYGVDQLRQFTDNAVTASWLDDSDKAALRKRLENWRPHTEFYVDGSGDNP
ncbi:adenosine deaminase Add [Gordonia polyisoprenivorans VH2]|uniref:Adenosine deaminase Add n=1 Tax=Gordonia polyisoprenivorans (strain DSM 44266 / VH2) TaxID=1112204 RepID=H6N2Z3_GORPV|nr:adenosine deaminase [Gordonia polyisoprenivorans]AFA75972.1 adenosine deaminase Add [Gordonia polyisoprenivorans VH2]